LSGRITLSTTDEVEALYEELEKDIENLYGGKSAFWRSCLMNFDDKHRLKAKIEMIEDRIKEKESEIKDLKLQKKGLKSELDEITEKTQEDNISNSSDVDQEFWDKTIEKIFVQDARDSADVKDRWDKWFDGRHKLFANRYHEISAMDLKNKILDKAETKGFEEEVKKLR